MQRPLALCDTQCSPLKILPKSCSEWYTQVIWLPAVRAKFTTYTKLVVTHSRSTDFRIKTYHIANLAHVAFKYVKWQLAGFEKQSLFDSLHQFHMHCRSSHNNSNISFVHSVKVICPEMAPFHGLSFFLWLKQTQQFDRHASRSGFIFLNSATLH